MRAEDEKNQDNPLLEIDTSRGTMLVELFEDEAPNTVASFVELAEKGFFDRQLFHRCLAYFMIQGGDPQGTGAGGPGYNIKDEHSLPNARLHYRGSLSTANIGQPNTNGSQFFVTSVVTHHLNGRHTVFGRVLKGLEVAEVLPLDPTNKAEEFMMNSVKVIRKRDHPYVAEKITTPN
ncbi:MAG: peptidylprolyl isomerase [Planctomycetes bacterium]|nr:peptidylprolyl isomerase [Planctomycetota bacterium]